MFKIIAFGKPEWVPDEKFEKLLELEQRCNNYQPQEGYRHDEIYKTLAQAAIRAAKAGNFGVSACLTNKEGEIVHLESNQTSYPFKTPHAHAEKMLLDKFAKRNKFDKLPHRAFNLFSTFEPCLMCEMMICSHQKMMDTVYYAVRDKKGADVDKPLENELWEHLRKKIKWVVADISPELQQICSDAIFNTIDECSHEMFSHGYNYKEDPDISLTTLKNDSDSSDSPDSDTTSTKRKAEGSLQQTSKHSKNEASLSSDDLDLTLNSRIDNVDLCEVKKPPAIIKTDEE